MKLPLALRRLWRRRRGTAPHPAGGAVPPGEAERLLRRLDFPVIRRLDGLRQGEHRNVAYGAGLDLAELRPYQPGDDVRALDWNVTARLGQPYVRRYHEDRELTAWLVLDLTASTDFGSARQTKRDLLIDVAGTLARLLTARGDRVGALLYTGSAPRLAAAGGRPGEFPAELVASGSGRTHTLQLLRRALGMARRVPPAGTVSPPGRDSITDIGRLLEQTFRTATQRSLVLVVSDFLDGAPASRPRPQPAGAENWRRGYQSGELGARRSRTADAGLGWERAIAPLAQRHELVGIWLRDPREMSLPDVGVVTFEDGETGEQVVVDTSQPGLREAYAALAAERTRAMEMVFARNGAALWQLLTSEPFVPALVRFLEQRRRTLPGAQRLRGRVA